MKAEPDTRIVKGKDVKFSVDDFENDKTTAWEGVRNHEAKNLMKEMKMGDQILFYHSNCKTPGVAGFAEVSKEAYPDHSAWDSSHPYYDPKSDKENPKWFMIDAIFQSRAANLVPLSLFKYLGNLSSAEPPEELEYIEKTGLQAIKTMDLVVRGRLSVQRATEDSFNAVKLLAEKGGWEEMGLSGKAKPQPKAKKAPAAPKKKTAARPKRRASAEESSLSEEEDQEEEAPVETVRKAADPRGKRKRAKSPVVEDKLSDMPESRPRTRSRKK